MVIGLRLEQKKNESESESNFTFGDFVNLRFKHLLGLLFYCLIVAGCGSSFSGEDGFQASNDQRNQDFVRAKKAQIKALEESYAGQAPDSIKYDILIVSPEDGLMYSESLGLQEFGSQDRAEVRTQETEAKTESIRRVPTDFGTAENPYTTIAGSLTLPEDADLEGLDEQGEVAYNYFGLQYKNALTLDAGLVVYPSSDAYHEAKHWYGFAGYTPDVTQEYHAEPFQGWPQGGIPGGTTVGMRLDAISDANPVVDGNQPGFRLQLSYKEGYVHVAYYELNPEGDVVPNIPFDGMNTAVRRATTMIWDGSDEDTKMCDVTWSNVMVGTSGNLHLFGENEANSTGPGSVLQATDDVRIRLENRYHTETIDINCERSVVGLVVDVTGSMSGEIAAVRLALELFINSSFAEKVSDWFVNTFRDSVSPYGLTDEKETVLDWVSSFRASGGGDCPEESLGAIVQAADAIKDINGSRSLILVTDASPRTGSPAAVTAQLQENDIKLYVLLTGDCVASSGFLSESIRAQTILSARDVFSKMARDTGGQYVYMPGGTTADFTAVLEDFFEEAATGGSDNEPPILNVSVSPDSIWPPNHKMVEVEYEIDVVDNLDPNPTTEVVGVAVTEPDDIQGSGNTEPDFELTSDGRIFVRAERSGTGQKRVYTVTFKAEDNAGNTSFASADIIVPHDRRKTK